MHSVVSSSGGGVVPKVAAGRFPPPPCTGRRHCACSVRGWAGGATRSRLSWEKEEGRRRKIRLLQQGQYKSIRSPPPPSPRTFFGSFKSPILSSTPPLLPPDLFPFRLPCEDVVSLFFFFPRFLAQERESGRRGKKLEREKSRKLKKSSSSLLFYTSRPLSCYRVGAWLVSPVAVASAKARAEGSHLRADSSFSFVGIDKNIGKA